MQSLKSVFGVARALVPVIYFGGLLYYFMGVGGSVQGVWDIGLGPTVVGLGVVVLLLCIPLVWKLMKMFSGPRWPGSASRPNAPPGHGDDDDDDSGAAADAIVARYLAQRSAEAAAAPAPRRAQGSGGPASRPSFGRKR